MAIKDVLYELLWINYWPSILVNPWSCKSIVITEETSG